MRSRVLLASVLGAGLVTSGMFAVYSLEVVGSGRAEAPREAVKEAYGRLPLAFEANHGQTDPAVKFLTRGVNSTVFLTNDEAVLSIAKPGRDQPDGQKAPLQTAVVRMQLQGADVTAAVSGQQRLPGTVNHFIGDDPKRWRTSIPTYGRVAYKGVYPGIDVVYYGRQGQLEYDFVVAPGADPGIIRLQFAGAQSMAVDSQGDLVIQTPAGEVRQHKPVLYQEVGGDRRAVDGRFVLDATTVRFDVGRYERSRPLVIDPLLAYSTFLGGGGTDVGFGIAVDSSGAAYVAGETTSANFPTKGSVSCPTTGTTSSLQCDAPGADAFVSKLNPQGNGLVYSTYLGGGKEDQAWRIGIDADGNAYVAGITDSADDPGTSAVEANFPTTANAYDRTCGTDGLCNAPVNPPASCGAASCPTKGMFDLFLAKLSAGGNALLYSTYLGGGDQDQSSPATALPSHMGVAVHGSRAYLGASTGSADFPVTAGAAQASCASCAARNLDAVLSVIDTAASGADSLVYSTFLGGAGNDEIKDVAVNNRGDAFVAGTTAGVAGEAGTTNDLPTTASAVQPGYGGGFSDAFVARVNPDAPGPTSLVYASYLGGGGIDQGWGVAVHSLNDEAVVTGFTDSGDNPATPEADGPAPYFPTTDLAFDPSFNGRATSTPAEPGKACMPANGCTIFINGDAFVARLTPHGTGLVYSTFLGGTDGDTGADVEVDRFGAVYVTGYTTCLNDNGGNKLATGAPTPPPCRGSFPTRNPVQADMDGSYIGHELHNSPTDVFLAKLSPGGNSVLFGTYLGGRDFDRGFAVAVRDRDERGRPMIPEIYVTGRMASDNYPTTPGAFRTTKPAPNGNRDAAISKIAGL